ncbi:hypothetical protein LPJ61_001834 [Coemansia biformis]|uniref:Uncharacterized protein n=1 Tax=Coemansia biformis TaxID=1286918 RepID=A0A9W7YGY3_9FUNG|nr:hypothetical protein LPJ61_001834 [Coemansia biformis]
MAARYSKVLTPQNAQMFVGGVLLATTAGHLWMQARAEHAAELQRRLLRVQQNMYWSMALVQRDSLPPGGDMLACTADQRRRRRRRDQAMREINAWWNGRVSALGSWAVRPGYLTEQARQAKSAAGRNAAIGWREAMAAAGRGSEWMVDQLATAVQWNAVAAYLGSAWCEERAKWQRAHTRAIASVHPRYTQCAPVDKSG